ncbi:VOC family protein [Stappia sp. F7233]|uniref:VOC family protein n=1 Tax=Stappia albiluteola TaxID=2758565 RepID=A0A839AA12_9HYPH|nr:VOC family protein [Stappia albiluteola]MBA5775767.1 VOC family protein [Stappia albiluteola]
MAMTHGSFVWYELMTTDTAAAERFYTSVIGWSAKDAGMPGMNYTLLSAGDAQIAGLMAQPEEVRASGAPPAWLGYILVDDVDGCASEIATKGGKVHRQPDDIPGVGRFAVVADPHGAIFCLFKGRGEPPADRPAPGTPGTPGWHELMAGDGEQAFAFYSDIFGWTKADAMDMGPMGIYQIFAIDGVPAGGIMTKPEQVPVPNWGYYFNVEAIDAAIERVNAGGGQIINGPMEVPGGSWIVQGFDPQGGYFCLVAPKR